MLRSLGAASRLSVMRTEAVLVNAADMWDFCCVDAETPLEASTFPTRIMVQVSAS
jgi:hypothetical protein